MLFPAPVRPKAILNACNAAAFDESILKIGDHAFQHLGEAVLTSNPESPTRAQPLRAQLTKRASASATIIVVAGFRSSGKARICIAPAIAPLEETSDSRLYRGPQVGSSVHIICSTWWVMIVTRSPPGCGSACAPAQLGKSTPLASSPARSGMCHGSINEHRGSTSRDPLNHLPS